MAPLRQFVTESAIIEDLSIKYENDTSILVKHWIPATRREINDAKPPVTESDTGLSPQPLIVRPASHEELQQPVKLRAVPSGTNRTGYAAHGLPPVEGLAPRKLARKTSRRTLPREPELPAAITGLGEPPCFFRAVVKPRDQVCEGIGIA
jgi:hypothetical protein